MIFAHDKGRLCNNILQYGHVYAWAREHGRNSMSMRFAYKYQYFHICHTLPHNFLTYVIAKYGSRWGLLPVVEFNEEGKDYSREEAIMQQRRHIVVEGWYAQWFDLFLKYKEEILQLFAFDERVMQRPDHLMSSAPEGCLRLGVHVRRGDYRTFHNGRFFYTDEQYIALIRQFIELHKDRHVHVYVCGNDRSLNRDAYRQQFPNVEFPCGNPGEDLYLLSQCDYLIGPPSTFSLVASMYHDVPLYWVKDATQPITADSFGYFDQLFKQIL